MITIYRVVWEPDVVLPDRGGYVEFLNLTEAEAYRDEHFPSASIENLTRDLGNNTSEIDTANLETE